MAAQTVYDVIAIGGGPAGYSAAFRAAQLGLSVALVEVFKTGGVCLHAGCIPYKALEGSVRTYTTVQNAARFGVKTGKPAADLSAMIDRKNEVVDRLAAHLDSLIKKHKVTLFQGLGAITGPGSVSVRDLRQGTESVLRGRNIVLATGSMPRALPGIMPDGVDILYSDHVVDRRALPASLAIIGGGAIGVETSTFYAALGCQVTILEAAPRLMMLEDEEISAELLRRYQARGIAAEFGVTVSKVEKTASGVGVDYQDADGSVKRLNAACLLVAAGREAFLNNLGLPTVGVKSDRGYIVTDGRMRTNVAGIYAAGDISGPPLLADKAMAEGTIAAEAIAGLKPQPLDQLRLPHCTFGEPEIGSVGLTEEEVVKAGLAYTVGRAFFETDAKAMCEGRTDGFVKVIAEKKTGRILGAHVIGGGATELIAGYVEAMTAGGTITQAQLALMAHPTRGEALREAALDAQGRAPLK